MRLIDADALINALMIYQYPYGVHFLVSTQPTIDPASLAEYLRRLGYEVKKCQH